MTIHVALVAENFGDRSYAIEANGQEAALVVVHESKGKVEIQFPVLARTEPHTIVLAPNYYGVESRDPELVEPA